MTWYLSPGWSGPHGCIQTGWRWPPIPMWIPPSFPGTVCSNQFFLADLCPLLPSRHQPEGSFICRLLWFECAISLRCSCSECLRLIWWRSLERPRDLLISSLGCCDVNRLPHTTDTLSWDPPRLPHQDVLRCSEIVSQNDCLLPSAVAVRHCRCREAKGDKHTDRGWGSPLAHF